MLKIQRIAFPIVVSAPSGAGKTSLCNAIADNVEEIHFAISVTSRKPRVGEIDGREYIFISEREFEMKKNNGELVEWAEVHGNLYGTQRSELEPWLKRGIDVLLDIDVQGGENMRKLYPDGIYIFVVAPSEEEYKRRLLGRKTESEESMKRRINQAKKEIAHIKNYNYAIVNDDFEKSVTEICSIILAERRKISRMKIEL